MTAKWKMPQMGEIAEINPRRPADISRLPDDFQVTFVPMSAVNQHLGVIDNGEVRPFCDVKKGFTYFAEGDVIFAKITPCMQNGKSAIASNLANRLGFGSTEFHVIRPHSEKVLPEWLWYFVRQESFRREGMFHFRGAVGQQRVPADYLSSSVIPLPTLNEQRRIVARIKECMERVEEIEGLRTEAMQERDYLLESLIEAEYQQAEGEQVTLADVCSIASSLVDPREQQYIDLLHIGGGNIEAKTSKLLDLKTAREEKLKSSKFTFDDTMVLYNKIRPYLKKVARPDFSGLCSADMYPLSPDSEKLTRDYLFYLLLSRNFTEYAIAGSNRAGMPKVNRKHLFAYKFTLPSIDKQHEITEALDAATSVVEKLRADMTATVSETSALRESILRKAFAGEL